MATYYYDSENRRVRKEVAGGATTDYLYDGWRVIEERPVVSGVQGAASRQKVYGNYLDEVLVMDTDADADGVCNESGTDTRHYYHQNSIYSVVAISNVDGGVVEAYEYDPYGKHVRIADGDDADSIVNFNSNDTRTTMGASLIGNTNTFTGQIFDPESGLHYYKNRYYSCELGRFVSRDPLGYHEGQNLFLYVNCDPIAKTDSMGLKVDDDESPSGVEVCERPLAVLPPWWKRGPLLTHAYLKIGDWTRGYQSNSEVREENADSLADKRTKCWEQPRTNKKKRRLPSGKPCKCASIGEIQACVKKEAENSPGKYRLVGHNCGSWAEDILKRCCARKHIPGPY